MGSTSVFVCIKSTDQSKTLYNFAPKKKQNTMLRTHTCGELRSENIGKRVTLSGWVQKIRDKGGMIWIDLRDRYGITQLVFDEGKTPQTIVEKARTLGREFVIQAEGLVIERFAKMMACQPAILK
jgi:aspartyl-tRNA synthetase